MSPLGLGIALILLVIVGMSLRKPETFVRGRVVERQSVWGSADDGVKFVGTFEEVEGCDGTDEYCRGYAIQVPRPARRCESFDVGQVRDKTQNALDNIRVAAQSAVTRVSRVMGGQSAGQELFRINNTTGTFDQFKENFQFNGDVAMGTQWAGDMNRLILPDKKQIGPAYSDGGF